MDVGDVKEVAAWVNLMPGPGRTPTLHVTGTVTAPTPCHEVVAEFGGLDPSQPPVYRVRIRFRQEPGLCPQVLTDKAFRHSERNYAGTATTVRVSSDTDSETAPIRKAR
ncbi:hypothetical protein [Stappia sp. TSB10GB4]|uniref:hypothetical protein n=1 Tax=Stappia sp. TSB10GB4 TaxID=2003584 RepID=UPI001644F490|nr:hypothetical protein [Stappia sp. TSB10GB4]